MFWQPLCTELYALVGSATRPTGLYFPTIPTLEKVFVTQINDSAYPIEVQQDAKRPAQALRPNSDSIVYPAPVASAPEYDSEKACKSSRVRRTKRCLVDTRSGGSACDDVFPAGPRSSAKPQIVESYTGALCKILAALLVSLLDSPASPKVFSEAISLMQMTPSHEFGTRR